MSEKDPLVYLDDILESIAKIEEYVMGKTQEMYEKDFLLQDGVHMRLQVIGESVAKLPNQVKEKKPEIPWLRISDLRNLISHDYAKVDFGKVWLVIENDLALLKRAVNELMIDLEGE